MAAELEGKKILVVDDDRDIRIAMEMALKDLGPEVVSVGDGNQAVREIEESEPDLVVLDMMLPKRSGFLVLERIKRDRTPGEKPFVIMVTGNLGNRHKIYAERLGVDRYITKPFRMNKLLEAIVELLS
ncbi:MAG: response regulator [Phycisphaerae bacterium]|jgi:DNA-binding response OmpR family regulator|nr:response regulator [Phycisphaerae bacterium]